MIEALINIGLPVALVVVGYFFGRRAEKRHYQSIFRREKELAGVLAFSERFPPIQRPAPVTSLVTGSVVISVDHFKRFVAGLKTIVGGRLTSYESLLDRARREAILRMKEQARAIGGDRIFNVKLETFSIAKGVKGSIGSVEVLAYGTVLIPECRAMAADAERYSNPEIPEGINTTDEHPLKELAWLGTGLIAVSVAVVVILGWLGDFAATFIPIEVEQRLAADLSNRLGSKGHDRTTAYLQGLADRLTQVDPLPPGVTVTVHYDDSEVVNAFATLGGHIVVTRGLLTALPNENALAMVVAHEIAHVRERHVMRSLGRGVLISIAMGLLMGGSGDDLAGGLVGQAGITAALTFSRDQESDADRLALRNVHALYGHVGGATTLFEQLKTCGRPMPPQWLSTHPDHRNRIAALAESARRAGWVATGALTPLPPDLLKADSRPAAAQERCAKP